MVAEILSTLASGLFSGAALYVTLVEHPARVSCGSRLRSQSLLRVTSAERLCRRCLRS